MTARVEPQDASPQDREGVALALRDRKRELRDSLGIEEIGVFGSFARGSAPVASDLDIYVRT
jgi:predicted nucleotidyltransferase